MSITQADIVLEKPNVESRLTQKHRALASLDPIVTTGEVAEIAGLVVKCKHMQVPLGTLCEIHGSGGKLEAEVVALTDTGILLMPFGELRGLRRGDKVRTRSLLPLAPAGNELLGRVLNGRGELIDGGPPIDFAAQTPIYRDPPPPLARKAIDTHFPTGVRAIDALFPCGQGQRMGIFSGSGVGKSVLLAMIARQASSDVNVIALIGERGREVRSFLDRELSPAARRRSVVVVTTSNEPALSRLRGAYVATAIAEYFRDRGKDVLLLMDSLTRFATAQREVGLSVGEPPTTKGYPPSLFALLPRLLERAGPGAMGTITGVYTLLVEGDDISDPIADAVRASLDGHLWLSRELAARGEYPAIDPFHSVSRLARDVVAKEQLVSAKTLLALLSKYRESETLIKVGAYKRGTDPELDVAVALNAEIKDFLKQDLDEEAAPERWQPKLFELAQKAHAQMTRPESELSPEAAGVTRTGRVPAVPRPGWLFRKQDQSHSAKAQPAPGHRNNGL